LRPDHARDDDQARDDHEREGDRAALLEDHAALGRDSGDDTGGDQQRHAVADTALGDELAEPHDHHGAGHHDDDDGHQPHDRLVVDHVARRTALLGGRTLQQPAVRGEGNDAGGLQQRQRDREVARVLRHLGLAGLPLLAQLLEARDHHRQQLHDDARGDVGHDADREHRQLQQRAAGEHVDQRVELLLGRRLAVGRLEAVLDDLEVHTRRRQRRTEPVQHQEEDDKEDLLPQFRRAEHGDEGGEH